MDIPEILRNEELIFHFTKTNIAIENILYERSLRFSPLHLMNDPYEYQIVTGGVYGRGIDPEIITPATQKLRKSILVDSKLGCFVKNKNKDCDVFELPYIKPRSWAQYGQGQRGVCLGFNKKKLLNVIKKCVPAGVIIYESAVFYDLDSKYKSKKATVNYNNDLSVEDNIARHINTNRDDIFFRKYKDFRDEDEYRIAVYDKRRELNNYFRFGICEALEAVILGDLFPDVYFDLVKELSDNLSAKVFSLKFATVPSLKEIKNRNK